MKVIIVCSERLIMKPRSLKEMQNLYEIESDMEMKQAYLEMIEEMKKDTSNEYWASDWSITLKSGEEIGGIGFKGKPNQVGSVEVGYGINPNYQRQGYATEALRAMVRWAFTQDGVECIEAQTEEWNEISKKVLRKNDFMEIGMGIEGNLFAIRKEK